jgi:exonuclease SbcD
MATELRAAKWPLDRWPLGRWEEADYTRRTEAGRVKFLHASDLHAGRQTHGRIDPKSGLNSAVASAARCWGDAVARAIDEGCELVLVAGDAFDSRNPDAATLALFMRQIRALRSTKIPIVLLAGNHDGPQAAGRYSILDALDDRPHVWAIARPEIVDVAGIRIAGLPWASKANLAAAGDGYEAEDRIDLLRRVLDRLRAHSPDVLTLHWPIAGSVLGTERDVSIIGEEMLTPADLEGFRYVAAGHLHKAQRFGTRELIRTFNSEQTIRELVADPVGWYAGGIDRFDFGDEGQDKGALHVILGSDYDSQTFVETPARSLVTIDIHSDWDVNEIPDVEGAIVRVRGKVTPAAATEALPDVLEAIRDGGAELVLSQIEVERASRPRVEAISRATDPLEAFRLWSRANAERFDSEDPLESRDLEGLARDLIEGREIRWRADGTIPTSSEISAGSASE